MNSSKATATPPSRTTPAPSAKSTPKSPESAVQRQIIVALQKAGWLVVKLIQTNLNGITDLLALRGARYVWIEVKREGGTVAPLQAFRHDELRKYGAEVIVAYSTEDVKHLLIKKN